MRKTAAKLLTVAALATSIATVAGGTAVADPAAGVTPRAIDFVGTGSDTTQAVLNQLAADYNASLTDPTAPRVYSWDATPTGTTITPKAGAATIARPNGSGAGIKALTTYTNTTVDFARSSRGPQPTDPTTDDFVSLAKDAVAWAAPATGNAPANLSTANLKDIYTCAVTNWHDIDASLPNATIKPFLPQSDSGTRSFFLTTIGGGVAVTPGACVTSGTQENQGSDPALADVNALVPYSVAHYIGQVYYGKGAGADVQGPLTIRNVDGVTGGPVDTTTKTISSAYAATPYSRVVYNVFRDAEWTSNATLRAIFGKNGWLCTNGGNDLKSFGFLPLSSFACGSVTHS
ncbi:PstS family phosphate ABC transporter substrate-binding protein [Kitasatospora sp. NPDC018619]|uniref:PstS family phosphate ABC transporter substrate-binding protein n=1 Tax=unclassified Kitasatospora TaxID=2633591 RepID=UPI0037921351